IVVEATGSEHVAEWVSVSDCRACHWVNGLAIEGARIRRKLLHRGIGRVRVLPNDVGAVKARSRPGIRVAPVVPTGELIGESPVRKRFRVSHVAPEGAYLASGHIHFSADNLSHCRAGDVHDSVESIGAIKSGAWTTNHLDA